MTYLLKG
nr:leader 1 [synthetic construct]